MIEYVCYSKDGAAFHRLTSPYMLDVVEVIQSVPDETFGVLIHDALTGEYLGRM